MKKAFLLLSIAALLLPADGNVIEPTAGGVEFRLTEKNWGENEFYRCAISSEKTPDGEDSLEITIPAGEKKGILIIGENGAVADGASALIPDWEEFTFSYKSNGAGGKIALMFQTVGSNGKTIYSNYAIPLIEKEWKTLSLKGMHFCSSNEGTRLDKLAAITFMGERKDAEQKLWIGPVRFRQRSNVILTPVKTAIAPVSENGEGIPFAEGYDGSDGQKSKVQLWRKGKSLFVRASQELDASKMVCGAADENSNVWADDSFQLVLGPGNDGKSFHQFIVNSKNVRQSFHESFDKVADAFVRAKNAKYALWKSEVKKEAGKWTADLEIDLESLGIEPPIAGLQIHFNNPSLGTMSVWTGAKSVVDAKEFGVLGLPEKASELKGIRFTRLELNSADPKPGILTSAKGTAYLSSPEGKICVSETEAGKKSVFSGYVPAGGEHRLAVVRERENLFFCAAFVTAPVKFVEEQPYLTNLLCPAPKEREMREKSFFIPPENILLRWNGSGAKIAAEKMRENWKGFLQKDADLKQDSSLPENTILLGNVKPSAAPGKPEGYQLSVEPEGILIAGSDAPGLLHGVRTLEQLMRYAYLANTERIPAQKISDWPELPNRIWNAWSDCRSLSKEVRDGWMPGNLDILNRYAMNSKMNLWLLNNSGSFGYRSEKLAAFTKSNVWMTAQEMEKVAEYCRERYFRFVPGIHAPEHAVWITDVRPDMTMPGYGAYDANPLHPEFDGILFGAIQEMLDAAKPELFMCMNDEWYHLPKGERTDNLNGIPKKDVFRNTVRKERDYLKARGVGMVMYSDMLDISHNGGKPYDTAEALESLPKDIILLNWGAGADTIKRFSDRGFENWIVGNKAVSCTEKALRAHVTGAGVINYASIAPDTGYGAAGMLYSADRAWNFGVSPISYSDFFTERVPNLIAMYSVDPNPAASKKFVPLKLETNAAVSGIRPPEGSLTVGSVPMILSGNRAVRAPANLKIGKKASALLFLHAAELAPEKQEEFRKEAWKKKNFDGIPVGKYRVLYADGTAEELPLTNTGSTGLIKPYHMTCPASECAHPLRTRFTLPLPEEKFLYQWEWVNPHPEKEILSVAFESGETAAVPYLFALTLREPR